MVREPGTLSEEVRECLGFRIPFVTQTLEHLFLSMPSAVGTVEEVQSQTFPGTHDPQEFNSEHNPNNIPCNYVDIPDNTRQSRTGEFSQYIIIWLINI